MTSQSILITGCSTGIGFCAAKMLKERGYRVFASARKSADVEKLKAQGFESVQLDLNDIQSMRLALTEILEKTGGTLDALFNNAGYLQAGAIEDLSRESERIQFETNVFGPIELTRLVLPIMRQQGHGRIIFNSSILGVITIPYYGAYNASKFALEGFGNTLRQELRGTDIFVSLINPGPITSALRGTALKHYQTTLGQRPDTVHRQAYDYLENRYFKTSKREERFFQGPEAVVKQLIHALESKHPKAHYFVGFPAKLLAILHRILPDRAFDWVISKAQ